MFDKHTLIKSINLAKTIAIFPALWYNYRGQIRIIDKLSLRQLEGCLPLGQTLGLRTFAGAKLRAGCLLESWQSREYRGGFTALFV